jgi:hypothetical protein
MAEELAKKEEEKHEGTEPVAETVEPGEEMVEESHEVQEAEMPESPEEEAVLENPDQGETTGDSSRGEEPEEPGEEISDAVPKGDSYTMAQNRVVAARRKVENAEEEIEECLRNIRSDLEVFEAYERERLAPVFGESRRILESLGMEEKAVEPALAELELENPEEEKLEIRDLSSGKGSAFFWGLLAAVATVGGWYAYAVGKAGTSLIPTRVPDMATLSTLAGKVSLLTGPAENPSVGAAIVIGSALVVWWLVYMVLVAIRAAKNRRIAEEVEEQAGFYCRKKEECKEMMEQVREHLATLKKTVEKYEVILDEKNASLRRALFIEEAENFDGLHERSKEIAREVDALLRELDRLLSTPMAKSGVLTPESTEALRHAKRVINDQILRLYN